MDVHQQLNVFISTLKINNLFTRKIVSKLVQCYLRVQSKNQCLQLGWILIKCTIMDGILLNRICCQLARKFPFNMLSLTDSEVYFLYGYGGTSKTFVWKTLSSAIRSNGSIVLAVASSVIASILQPKHSTNTIYYHIKTKTTIANLPLHHSH
ncbi:hypothetical protein HKD37_07G018774 [Glycine soja]